MSRKANPALSTGWEKVNLPPEAVLLDVTRCCHPVRHNESAIDSFYENQAETLRLGNPTALADSSTLGRLLILGLVTGVEAYFRNVLHGATTFCPLVRQAISEQMIALGAVDFYGADQAALGLFERVSFAGGEEIKKRTKAMLGLPIADNSSLGAALDAFDIVCHMRHASVHTQGVLSRGNAQALGIFNNRTQIHLVVDLPHLHMAAKACMGVVRAYNLFAYQGILQRWLNERILTGVWKTDKSYFAPLYKLFRSETDAIGPASAYSTYKLFRPAIVARLAGT
ncbi:hypothetical protein AB0J43_04520 [Nonomuraea fuscirosea]